MKRRDFMKRALASSLAMTAGGFSLIQSGKVRAQTGYDGTLLFLIDATGAWEPVDFCDPLKQPGDHPYVAAGTRDEYIINQELLHQSTDGPLVDGRFVTYERGDLFEYVTNSGQTLRFAPKVNAAGAPIGPYTVGAAGYEMNFFQTYLDDMMLIKGINTRTNSHAVGQRQAWSGTTRVGFPSIGAMWAAVQEDVLGAPMAMTFSSTGGYDATAGLLSAARASQKAGLVDLTDLYAWAPSDPEGGQKLYSDYLLNHVLDYQNERTNRLLNSQLPPHVRNNVEKLQAARLAESNFQFLADALEEVDSTMPGQFIDHSSIVQASTLVAAMKAGICTSAMLNLGGFDTHSNHYAAHPNRLETLFNAAHYVIQQLMAHGLWQRTVLVIGSDFGRTRLNGGAQGKDHWPTTSYIVMGQGIGGGRSVGYTYIRDIDYTSTNPDPPLIASRGTHHGGLREESGTLVDAPVEMISTGEAFALEPAHIHYALRDLLGMNAHPYADLFGLPMDITAQGVKPLFVGS